MADADAGGRARQRLRTRRQLLDAAARLMEAGEAPTLEEVAEEALVSRATAYRYFSNVESLLIEAALDLAFPAAERLFETGPSDAAERVVLAERAVDDMAHRNEHSLRLMLIHSLKLASAGEGSAAKARQNRRVPLIEAALEPALPRLASEAAERLVAVLALIVGTESMIVFKDVLGMDRRAASAAKGWAIRALVAAALDKAAADGSS